VVPPIAMASGRPRPLPHSSAGKDGAEALLPIEYQAADTVRTGGGPVECHCRYSLLKSRSSPSAVDSRCQDHNHGADN
jgi:hypothetical protein